MRVLTVFALLFFTGCGLTNDDCGLSCDDSDTGNCVCEPHSGSTRQFWVRTGHGIDFYRCDCTLSRRTGGLSGRPVPSDPGRGECFAIAVSSVDPPNDCETSFNENTGYNPCVRKINLGGSLACGNPP